MTSPTLYETDFNLWIEQTVKQLQRGQLQELDVENLIEEVASMGRSDKREVYSRLRVLLLYLLKWQYQPAKQTGSWIATIDEQRSQLQLILRDSPSLKPYLQDQLADCYQSARQGAAKETHLAIATFPLECPFTEAQMLDIDYLPDSPSGESLG